MLTPQIIELVRAAARDIGVKPSHLAAFVAVESNGAGLTSEGPVIRWEGHYFDRLVPKGLRAEARKRKLASPKVGGIPNPRLQADRYVKLLEPARQLDEDAALQSVSVGLGQVMVANHASLGYETPQEMWNAAHTLGGQIDMMVRFLKANRLVDEVRAGLWAAVARVYNGPAYKVNKYDVKMASAAIAYAYLDKDEPAPKAKPAPVVTQIVARGDKGAVVNAVQESLRQAGFTVRADGDFGQATFDAVKLFQASRGLAQDGKVGPATWGALQAVVPVLAAPSRLSAGVAEVVATNPVARLAALGKRAGTGAAGLIAVGSGVDATGLLEKAQGLADKADGVRALTSQLSWATAPLRFAAAHPWLLLLLGSIVVALAAHFVLRQAVEDERSGVTR